MKTKMTNELKKLYSNLGLTDAIFENVAGIAVSGLAADADEAAIHSRAKEMEALLKSFQSHIDTRVTDAVKKATGNKGGDDVPPQPNPDEKPAWLQEILDAQKAETEALKAKIAVLEGANAQKTFDDMVAKVAKELNLSGGILDLCKAGLSSDMDETKIKDVLGAAKKTLIDGGMKIDEQSNDVHTTSKEAADAEADKWLDENFVSK